MIRHRRSSPEKMDYDVIDGSNSAPALDSVDSEADRHNPEVDVQDPINSEADSNNPEVDRQDSNNSEVTKQMEEE